MEHLIRLVIAGVKYNAIALIIVLLSYLVLGIAMMIFNRK